MADFAYPKTAITFTFSVSERELEDLGTDVKAILNLPDSRPAPEQQPAGYTHTVGNTLSPTTRKLFDMLATYAAPEVKRERRLKTHIPLPGTVE